MWDMWSGDICETSRGKQGARSWKLRLSQQAHPRLRKDGKEARREGRKQVGGRKEGGREGEALSQVPLHTEPPFFNIRIVIGLHLYTVS